MWCCEAASAPPFDLGNGKAGMPWTAGDVWEVWLFCAEGIDDVTTPPVAPEQNRSDWHPLIIDWDDRVPEAAGANRIDATASWHVCKTVIHRPGNGLQEVKRVDCLTAIRVTGDRHTPRCKRLIQKIPAPGWEGGDADTGCPNVNSDSQVHHGRLR